MLSVSTNYQNKANADKRKFAVKIEVSGASNLTADNIIEFAVQESLAGNNIEIGSMQSAVLNLKCRAIGYTFQSKTLKPYLGFDNEWCPLGTFYVTDVELVDGEYTITAYDKMAFLDVPYVPTVSIPNTCQAIVNNIASQKGFLVEATTYPSGALITELEEGVTCRQLLGYVAGLMGTNARFDRNGKLAFTWYKQIKDVYGDVNGDNLINSADITYINNNLYGSVTAPQYESIMGRLIVGSAILGGEVVDSRRSLLSDVDEDHVVDADDTDEIQAYIDGTPYPDTKVGTVVGYYQTVDRTKYYMGEFKKGSVYTISSLVSGTEEAQITSGTGKAIAFFNPYMTQALLDSIRASILPFQFMTGEMTYIGNPAWEIGDILRVVDDSNYDMPVMSQKLSYNGGFNIKFSSYGLSDEKTIITQSMSSVMEIKREVNAIAKRTVEITEELNNAQGMLGGTYKEIYGTDIDPSALSGLPIGFRIIDNADNNKYWQYDYNGLRYTADGGASFKVGISNSGSILADNLVANAVISNHITAQDITITGGSISWSALPSDVASGDEIPNITVEGGKVTKIDGHSIETGEISADKITAGTITAEVDMYAPRLYTKASAGTGESAYYMIGVNSSNNLQVGSPNAQYLSGYNDLGLYAPRNIYLCPIGSSISGDNWLMRIGQSGTTIRTNLNVASVYADSFVGPLYGAVGDSTAPQRVYLNPVTASVDPVYRTTNTGALGVSSSLRKWKKDIQDVTADEVNPHRLYDLPVRQFHWREDAGLLNENYDYSQWSIGFIAEEMDEIYPRATIYRNGELASWGERNLIPAMLKLIQEQHAEIESLKEEVNELKK